MPFMTINLNTSEFNERELKAIEDLSSKRLLARSLATAMKEYLHKVNPETLPTSEPEEIMTLKSDDDIDAALKKYNKLRPTLLKFELITIKDALKKQLELRGGELQIVITTDSLRIIQ
jgi:hypothetical protein